MELIKRKRGRPAKIGARRRGIFAKCNDDEYSMIARAARLSGMTMSEFIRNNTYKASVDVINKRQEELKEMCGFVSDDYTDEYGNENEADDGNYE